MTDAIQTNELTKRYADTLAVASLDLRVSTGEVFGFVGPNGAGKSTTIAMILGLRRPTDGEIRVFGGIPTRDEIELRNRTGSLPEHYGLFSRLTGRDHLNLVLAGCRADESETDLLERVGLVDAGDRHVRTYSTGMAQRLRLAMALVGQPDLLVLDEPASGLDPEGIVRLREIIKTERERGATIFFSSHQLDDVAAVSDRVGFLVNGTLREVVESDGSPETLASHFTRHVREQQ